MYLACLFLLSLSPTINSMALPRPNHCSNLAVVSCSINTTTSTTQLPHRASSSTLAVSTGSETVTASGSVITNIATIPLGLSSTVLVPGHCLHYATQFEPTICHLETHCTTSEHSKQSVDLNTIVNIVFGASQVLLSIWPTHAAWRFLHQQSP
jgi:hypothetical protein